MKRYEMDKMIKVKWFRSELYPYYEFSDVDNKLNINNIYIDKKLWKEFLKKKGEFWDIYDKLVEVIDENEKTNN